MPHGGATTLEVFGVLTPQRDNFSELRCLGIVAAHIFWMMSPGSRVRGRSLRFAACMSPGSGLACSYAGATERRPNQRSRRAHCGSAASAQQVQPYCSYWWPSGTPTRVSTRVAGRCWCRDRVAAGRRPAGHRPLTLAEHDRGGGIHGGRGPQLNAPSEGGRGAQCRQQ